jgi:hypothetical protein
MEPRKLPQRVVRVRIKSVDDALDDAIGVMRAIQAKTKVADRRQGASSPLRSTTTEIVLRIAV